MADKDLKVQEKRDATVGAESTGGGPVFLPDADIYEDKDALYVAIDMPGVDREGVRIDLDTDRLSIYGKTTRPAFASKLTYSEYRIGDYSRSFMLPNTIERDGIDAVMKDGVLKLRLPKAEFTKPRKIEIKSA